MAELPLEGRTWWARSRAVAKEVRARVGANAALIVLAVIAATLAWTIAGGLVQDHQPFFAPIAAVIALNVSGGERGAQALRLLMGVFIGILAGEFSLWITDYNVVAMVLATACAMTVAAAINAERIIIGQAAASAILTTIFVGGASPGTDRLVDALIGAGVALAFSQLFFPARLVALLRRIEEDALNEMASMLALVGRSLGEDGEDSSEQLVNRLGDLSRPMAELSKARESSRSTVRLSTIRWGNPEPVLEEDEVIERLILLGESCLFLARTTTAMGVEEQRELAPIVTDMADVLTILADDLSSREAREEAVERALTAARAYGAGTPDDDPVTHATHLAVEMVATDIMVFAGIRFEEIEDVLQGDLEDPTVPHPQGEPWLPWLSWRPRWRPVRVRLPWRRPGGQ
ncbi:aromatic acid exporter family protein [Nocardiopsis sp. NPDC006938]|uniref:FUSC family protein n=1 Tax=Nocardiopsis sp. NPDC006938 TaxID=3364337 RepID=UPI0036C41DCA